MKIIKEWLRKWMNNEKPETLKTIEFTEQKQNFMELNTNNLDVPDMSSLFTDSVLPDNNIDWSSASKDADIICTCYLSSNHLILKIVNKNKHTSQIIYRKE